MSDIKIKSFWADSPKYLDEAVNKWLNETTNIKVQNISFSNYGYAGETTNDVIFASITYIELKSKELNLYVSNQS